MKVPAAAAGGKLPGCFHAVGKRSGRSAYGKCGPIAERRLQSGTSSTTDIGAERVAWADAARQEAGRTARE
jgi:hypothetical protein